MKYILFIALLLSASCDNSSTIWNILRPHFSRAGTAAIMGNLEAESNLKSVIYQNSYKDSVGLTDQQYVDKVNSDAYPENKFVHDQVGFGLAQWTYYSRKQGLYNTCKKNSPHNIGDLHCQANYVVTELRTENGKLYNALTNDGDLYTLTSRVCKEYERPAVNNVDTRYSYAKKWYDRYK